MYNFSCYDKLMGLIYHLSRNAITKDKIVCLQQGIFKGFSANCEAADQTTIWIYQIL